MTKTERDKLRELAGKAKIAELSAYYDLSGNTKPMKLAYFYFHNKANPNSIVRLLDYVERLEGGCR